MGVVTVGKCMDWAAVGVNCSGVADHRKRGIIDGFIDIIGGPGNMTPIAGGIPGICAIKPISINIIHCRRWRDKKRKFEEKRNIIQLRINVCCNFLNYLNKIKLKPNKKKKTFNI